MTNRRPSCPHRTCLIFGEEPFEEHAFLIIMRGFHSLFCAVFSINLCHVELGLFAHKLGHNAVTTRGCKTNVSCCSLIQLSFGCVIAGICFSMTLRATFARAATEVGMGIMRCFISCTTSCVLWQGYAQNLRRERQDKISQNKTLFGSAANLSPGSMHSFRNSAFKR